MTSHLSDKYILTIDQGTSSTKTIVFNENGEVIAKATEALKTYYGANGFVEQNPEEVYQNVLASVKTCLIEFEKTGRDKRSIVTCGISNQRETFVVWDKNGVPLHHAIVWQCKRSIQICKQLKADGLEPLIKERTGLIIDPYFSATKLMWLYQNDNKVKEAIDGGSAYFGTIDTWLLYKLTAGEKYLTDHTNASRTLFFNLKNLNWDKDVLKAFGLENLNLPTIQASASDFGSSNLDGLIEEPIKVSAMIGDSHAAAFGEGCFSSGTAKATLGTGCSVLMNIGEKPSQSHNGMMTTVCWSIKGRIDYAFEGVIVSCGATVEWLKNELNLFKDSAETEMMAKQVKDNNGIYLIPAFSGLGAPYWDMNRKGEIVGLNFNANKNHVVRAALESVAYQLKDVILAMEEDTGIKISGLMVNGGMSRNEFLVQFIANVLQCNITKGNNPDVSALGAGLLAGLSIHIYKDLDHISSKFNKEPVHFEQDDIFKKFHQEWLGYLNNKKSSS